MASNPLFIIPDFFLHFPNELSYGYFRPFSLPSQRNFPISFKPKVAIAEFFWKMQKKNLVFHFEGRRRAMPLSLKNLLLRSRLTT